MIKIGIIKVSDIDKGGDFEFEFEDCSTCGQIQYLYLSSEEAHSLMYHLKKQLLKNEKTL
jgi:hypothetical protein